MIGIKLIPESVPALLIAAVLWLSWPVPSFANPPMEFGIRGGTDATGTRENYNAQEVYALYHLPWESPVAALPSLRFRFDAGLARIEAQHDEGLWLAVGGDLVARPFGNFLELEAGWRPTWLPDYQFGKDHFGGQLQFSTHVGAALTWKQTVWTYRFQHTSNAGIYHKNPGLDLHLFGVGFRF